MHIKKLGVKISLAIAALGALCFIIYIYMNISPSSTPIFPRCPTLVYLGVECPGCGSQRAVHHLLNFEILSAMRMNFMLILAIPYILTLWGFKLYFRLCRTPSQGALKWRKRLFGSTALYILAAIITIFGIARNFFDSF